MCVVQDSNAHAALMRPQWVADSNLGPDLNDLTNPLGVDPDALIL
jgi:hypothetical protein